MKKSNVVGFNRSRETKEQALERLFQDHAPALRGFLRLRMAAANATEHEDILQDVFMRLAKMDGLSSRLPAGRSDNQSFVIKVANNLILDIERRRKVRSNYLENQGEQLKEQIVSTISPDVEVQSRRELEQTKKVLMAMKPRWRDSFILHRFGNKSYLEIAQHMGVSSSQIEKYIRQAVKRLRSAAVEIRGVK
ncbi:RNA polymerase sigma factor [Porticoccus sp. W117]|uniref:RNA polymerase sigma factor n=1 Tax=Porticoccus sp. W117 TaxID=3054777 RepID=UPI002593F96C|nr:RNA polymerase sigma factor [Porticoccus sp. W117]MDM3871435.1 RNA polymerase sigma factor [Porticoccus sp. W117]